MDDLSGDIGQGSSSVADASPASDTGTSETTPAAAIAQPAGDGDNPTTGPIPFDRHKAALEGARNKTRAEVEAQYAWAKGVDSDRAQRALQLADALDRDAFATVEWLQSQIARDPRYAERHKPPAPPDAEPQPDLQTEDGRYAYSADQMRKWQAWRDKQPDSPMSRLAKLEQLEQQRDAMARAQQAANRVLEDAATWPHFDEHIADIYEAVNAAANRGQRLSVEQAYIKVVVPKLTQMERQQVVDDLNTKATAGAINPATPAAATPTNVKYTSFADGLKAEWRKLKGR